MDEAFYKQIKKDIIKYFDEGGAHDFGHTERVENLALQISEGLNIDMEILRTATILHDIKRKNGKNHGEEGSEFSKEFLKNYNFPEEKIDKVCYCIKVHRASDAIIPEIMEAKILQDADKLDVLGPIGVARCFSYFMNTKFYDLNTKPKEIYDGKSDNVLNHFYEKILKITPESFHTAKAREIGKERYDFIINFVKDLERQIRGEL